MPGNIRNNEDLFGFLKRYIFRLRQLFEEKEINKVKENEKKINEYELFDLENSRYKILFNIDVET